MCTAAALPGKSRCAEHLAVISVHVQAWRERRRAEGGCIYCTADAVPGLVSCEAHRAAARARARASREGRPQETPAAPPAPPGTP